MGLMNEDGKVEYAFDSNGDLMLVDVLGTLDECRFTYNGIHVSKEVARQFYNGTDWAKDVEQAKKTADDRSVDDWKQFCTVKPPLLDPKLKQIIAHMYQSFTDGLLGKDIFQAPELGNVVDRYADWLKTG